MQQSKNYFKLFRQLMGTMLLFFMAMLGTFIGIIVLILMVFYIEDVYQETKYLASQFQHAEQKIEKVVPFMPTEQAPILKVRKKEYEEDNYVLFYQLNAQQSTQAEKYLQQHHAQMAPMPENYCIAPGIRHKWLLPRITRHYVAQPNDYLEDYQSFLVYESDQHLEEVEKFCRDDLFITTTLHLKQSSFKQAHVLLNIEQKILMVNYVKENHN